jgi:hypothetical protein
MKKHLNKVQFSITDEQAKALRVEATKRMNARGRRKIDTSEVLREAVDAWMKRRGR